MRCWHKDLIKLLPKQQLCGQWRECCAIAKSISEKGTTNHILINRIMDYPIDHFVTYAWLVGKEMEERGYNCYWQSFNKYFETNVRYKWEKVNFDLLFCNWHNDTYLRECIYNLEEKAICGGISYEEWKPIYQKYKNKYDLWGKVDLWKERE